MQIETEIFEKWKLAKQHGDAEKIHNKYNISAAAIRRALLTGRCSSETAIAINKFYDLKK